MNKEGKTGFAKKNIVLIGMPSSGKTTTGKLLAEYTGRDFVDTDVLISSRESKSCRDIVNSEGLERFLQVQEEIILGLKAMNVIIATGGGAVYSMASMEHLRKHGIIVYLKLKFEDIEKRVAPGRRFARGEGQGLMDIYNERVPLYEKYSDIIIDCSGKSPEEVADTVITRISETALEVD